MNFVQSLRHNRLLLTLGLLAGTWLLFNCIFFLGTNPSRWIDTVFQALARVVWTHVASTTLRDFLIYGLITGVGGFLVYVPNIMLLFLFSHILYETGISLRVARFVNPLFRRFGLDGNSFQPLLFGFGCSVTAIHGARFIKNPRSRLVTMLIAPFMSCGSKFGVYVLLISCIFTPRLAGTVLFGLYAAGVVTAIVSAVLFRALLRIRPETAADASEEVPLKRPPVRAVLKGTFVDGWQFCKKAGSVIVVASLCIWAISYWPGVSAEKYHALETQARETGRQIPSRQSLSYHHSYAASLGRAIEPVFRPLGQNWKNSIALVTSLAGRMTIISTLITLYGIEYSPQSHDTLVHALSVDPTFSKAAALAMMVFVLLCGSCLASIAMFFNETRSYLTTALFVGYPIVLAWVAGALVYGAGRMAGW